MGFSIELIINRGPSRSLRSVEGFQAADFAEAQPLQMEPAETFLFKKNKWKIRIEGEYSSLYS